MRRSPAQTHKAPFRSREEEQHALLGSARPATPCTASWPLTSSACPSIVPVFDRARDPLIPCCLYSGRTQIWPASLSTVALLLLVPNPPLRRVSASPWCLCERQYQGASTDTNLVETSGRICSYTGTDHFECCLQRSAPNRRRHSQPNIWPKCRSRLRSAVGY